MGAPSTSTVSNSPLNPQLNSSTPDSLADEIQSIDFRNSFNINASEFVPTKPSLSVAASEFVPGQFDSVDPGENSESQMEAGDTGEAEAGAGEPEQQHPSVTLLYDAMYQLTLEPGRSGGNIL